MKTQKIYCFGNPHLADDNLALIIADTLKIAGIEFIKSFSPEELFEKDQSSLVIMDTARGIEEIKVFSDISKLKSPHLVSLHDFDLSYFLKLMEKMGQLPHLTIIALPCNKAKKDIQDDLKNTIKELFCSNTK